MYCDQYTALCSGLTGCTKHTLESQVNSKTGTLRIAMYIV